MKRYCDVLAVLLLALAVGCSRPDQGAAGGQAAVGEPVRGDWAVVRLEGEPDSLNPVISSNALATTVRYGVNGSQILETLLQYDMKDWTFTQPLLAESYPEISADHLVYTFTVKDGIKWHDGQPFSVDDILFSAKATMCPFVDSAPLRSYFGDLTNVEILEGRKIRFTFNKPNMLNAFNLGSFYIVPKHVYDPTGVLDGISFQDMISTRGRNDANVKKFGEDFNRHPANRVPIGTGPYKFEKWDTGKQILLVRNEEYWGTKPYLDKIDYRIIPDYPAALTALKAGEIDFNPRLTSIQYAQQTSGEQFESQFQKQAYSVPGYTYIGWNAERPYFRDKRVRQALTMLIDRAQIIETLRFGLATPIEAHFNPKAPEYNTSLSPIPYSPERAMALLDEAGWKDTNGDGIRDKDGVAFRFEMLGQASSTFTDQLLPVLKEAFRKAGIDMAERRLEFNVFVDSLRDHKFDAIPGAWASPLTTDPYQLFHSSSIANRGSNYVSFKNPEADRLLEQARTEFDAEKRKQLYWRWQEIVYDEQPYTFLFASNESAAWQRRFQNVQWYPNRPGYDLRTWFVPVAQQKYTQVPLN